MSATSSGLMLAPNAMGTGVAAIITGRITLRTGHYRRWLVLGSLLAAVALGIMSQTRPGWPAWSVGAAMLLLGSGVGMALPVVSTASQNAADPAETGIVTAAAQFFRALGGSIGIAGLGTLLRYTLDSRLAVIATSTALPEGLSAKSLADNPEGIAQFTQPLRGLVEAALAQAIDRVFLCAVPLAAIVFLISLRLEERPLRTTTGAGPGARPPEVASIE